MAKHTDSFSSRATLQVEGRALDIYRLDALQRAGVGEVATLPYSLRVLLENLLRHEDGESVTAADIEAVAGWDASAGRGAEIAFRPARVLLQDFTGVPCVVDLAAMREELARMGGDPSRVNPLQPVDLVIDHSVQVDHYGTPEAFEQNVALEFARNRERYQLLRWGQGAFADFRAVPPGTGIVHQVNIEYLAQVVFTRAQGEQTLAYPDTLVGTDSHTTMVNGLGVLGWGVGGIEAEAAMLGQPVAMLLPEVVGFRLTGQLPEGATATDLVLTCVERLRARGVVGAFVEFCGPGLDSLSLPDRATIANMAPEYGATVGFFPVDAQTLEYLRLTGRSAAQVALVERYCKEQGLYRTPEAPEPRFSDVLELDMSTVLPCIAGPKRPQDRIPLTASKAAWRRAACALTGVASDSQADAWVAGEGDPPGPLAVRAPVDGQEEPLSPGDVVIAAITSCTNTSNPAVLIGAGLLARKARERGLRPKPWVKTSLAPGSQVVTAYLRRAGLLADLEQLGFHLVGYGCTTCIGNSGPLKPELVEAIRGHDLVVTSVLSGNRNFEGRISPHVRANYLASPPLVVAYALAGTLDIDLHREPLGQGQDGRDVFLRDLWPSAQEVAEVMTRYVSRELFKERYLNVFQGPAAWQQLEVPSGDTFRWDARSTYIRKPPFFEQVQPGEPPPVAPIRGARCLVKVGDSVTTDHISPAGAIAPDSPAAAYLRAQGVAESDFNSYGSRRGNHEVMVRGTFANVRLRNQLAPGTEGGVTRHLPDGAVMPIFDAAELYRREGVPLVVLAGREYGTGSSRDWAAKGTLLLGIRAVIAASFERIHRSNLVGMGVLPLQLPDGETHERLGLTGEELFEVRGLEDGITPRMEVEVVAGDTRFKATVRLDGPQEVAYYQHGGILPYVLRQLAAGVDG